MSVKSNTRNWTTFAKQDLPNGKTKRGWEKGRYSEQAKIIVWNNTTARKLRDKHTQGADGANIQNGQLKIRNNETK